MNREQIASKCHDIQVSLGKKQVPEFDLLSRVGMMVNLSLHIRGLPLVEYDKLRLVSSHYFNIPPLLFRDIIKSLAEVEFVELKTEGGTIKTILPTVPFYDNIYETIGEFAQTNNFSEPEELALKILTKLSSAPTEISSLYGIGAEKRLTQRNIQIGNEAGYIINKRARGKDILISPVFFSENIDIYIDLVAKSGTTKIKKILDLIKSSQGWPLSIIENTKEINGTRITDEELNILKTLAQDGAIKPPSITTPHSGSNYFMFTPAAGNSKLNPANREIYERAMALLSAVRQGQLLAKQYRIKWPDKILLKLKRDGYLNDTSETYDQYHSLAVLKVGSLEKTVYDRYRFRLIDTEENKKALDLAINMLNTGEIAHLEMNEDARLAIQKDQTYIESIIASTNLRTSTIIELDEESKQEFENILIHGLK